MKRKQLPQISNQPGFPAFLRRDLHEFMTWFVIKVNAAKPFVPYLQEGLAHSEEKQIVNINGNFGAGYETARNYLKDVPVKDIPIKEFNTANRGLYTFINFFHQMDSGTAKNYLTQIAQSGNPVAVLEGNNDSLWQAVGMLVFVPLTMILSGPFIRPFRISRIIFTYLIPILPLVGMIDGFLALFMLYNPDDLRELVSEIQVSNYSWKAGKDDNGRGGKIIYLLGLPGKA